MPIRRHLITAAAALLSTGCASSGQAGVAAGKSVQAEFDASVSVRPAEVDPMRRCRPRDACDSKPGKAHMMTTDLAGTVYALGTRADPARRTVTFDKIDWFFGKAATPACIADKVEIPPAAWCNDYYYRNRNDLQRTVSVADSATISVADYSSASPVPQKVVGLRALDKRFEGSETIIILTVRNGVIVDLKEQFTP
jgi:hypothetical protein